MLRMNKKAATNSLLIWLTIYECCFFPFRSIGVNLSYGTIALIAIWALFFLINRPYIVVDSYNGWLLPIIFTLLLFYALPNASKHPVYTLLYIHISVCILFCLTSNSEPQTVKRIFSFFKIMAIIYAVYIIVCRIRPNIYIELVLPHLKGLNKSQMIGLLRSGYGISISGSIIYGDFIIGAASFIVLSNIIYERPTRVLNLMLFILFYIAILFEGRRGELLTISIVYLVIILFTTENRQGELTKRLFIIGIVFFFGILIMGFLSNIGLIGRFTEAVEQLGNEEDTLNLNSVSSGRIRLWTSAWRLFLSSPIWGIGSGGFYANSGIQFAANVHNTYLQVLCENGILGFLLIMVPFIVIFIKTWSLLRFLNSFQEGDLMIKKSIVFSTGIQMFFLMEHFIDPIFFRHYFVTLFIISVCVYTYVHEQVEQALYNVSNSVSSESCVINNTLLQEKNINRRRIMYKYIK